MSSSSAHTEGKFSHFVAQIVLILFLFILWKHVLWVLLEVLHRGASNKYPQHIARGRICLGGLMSTTGTAL